MGALSVRAVIVPVKVLVYTVGLSIDSYESFPLCHMVTGVSFNVLTCINK